jgi:hypothetical protein
MIAPRPRAGLSQHTEREPMLDKNLDGWTSDRRVKRVVHVGGEAEHDLFFYAERLVLRRVFAKFGQKVLPWRAGEGGEGQMTAREVTPSSITTTGGGDPSTGGPLDPGIAREESRSIVFSPLPPPRMPPKDAPP